MCGIIAVVRRPDERTPPTSAALLDLLDPVPRLLADLSPDRLAAVLDQAALRVAEADGLLRGVPGVRALLADRALIDRIELLMAGVAQQVDALERDLDEGEARGRPLDGLEQINANLVRLKDACWAVERDRLRTTRLVDELAGTDASHAAIAAYTSIQQALSALDRLEVRGRDSAGIHVLVRDHALDLSSPAVQSALEHRGHDPLFGTGSVRVADGHVGFVYKSAAEIGELGDNTRDLRRAIRTDALLRQALAGEASQAVVLGHTRWASVGIISQPNAHPLNSDELDRADGSYVTAVLNGDVDNFADLKASDSLHIAPEITTDAKVIPALTSRQLDGGVELVEAFRTTVNRLEGSVAIAAQASAEPADLLLALRGSGQALYVGLADDAFVVASEPYGVVEETEAYLRMDGENLTDPDNPGSRGQVIRLRGLLAGSIEGVERWSYDGQPSPVTADEVVSAQITTRDIDRGTYPHFLLKEISEAPASFRKTLRGKLIETDDGLDVRLPPDALPDDVRARLRDGSIRRVFVIGQGTAAGAGHSLAAALALAAPDSSLQVAPLLATELSGFDLKGDMGDTLVVAISQSGTTTDTNRTVDLVRSPGRDRARDRQPSQQRPHRQSRRRALHLRRSRRRDERGVDQGVLLADRGVLPAGLRHRRRHRRAPTTRPPGGARRVAGAARRDGTHHRLAPPTRRGCSPIRTESPLLGDRRQRREPHCGLRGAHQALRALLQVDRLRLDGGQEAHRPVVGAADRRVRGRARRLDSRRRGQGSRHLPSPQSGSDRDRQRR